MARLEYRLNDELQSFPVLFYYDFIDKDEVSLRFACDYWVKNMRVYEKMHGTVDANKYIIYVRVAEEEHVLEQAPVDDRYWGGICIELREYREGTDQYPVVHRYQFQDDEDARLIMQSDSLSLQGKLWTRTSTDIDEDRKVFVYYAEPNR
jgi:hypothetical protein